MPSYPTNNYCLIAVEGPNGSGKTETTKHLVEQIRLYLKQSGLDGLVEIETISVPGFTALGKEIRQVLKERTAGESPASDAALFLTSMLDVKSYLENESKKGRRLIAIVDRWYHSTVSQQVTKAISMDAKEVIEEMMAKGMFGENNKNKEPIKVVDHAKGFSRRSHSHTGNAMQTIENMIGLLPVPAFTLVLNPSQSLLNSRLSDRGSKVQEKDLLEEDTLIDPRLVTLFYSVFRSDFMQQGNSGDEDLENNIPTTDIDAALMYLWSRIHSHIPAADWDKTQYEDIVTSVKDALGLGSVSLPSSKRCAKNVSRLANLCEDSAKSALFIDMFLKAIRTNAGGKYSNISKALSGATLTINSNENWAPTIADIMTTAVPFLPKLLSYYTGRQLPSKGLVTFNTASDINNSQRSGNRSSSRTSMDLSCVTVNVYSDIASFTSKP